MDPPPPELLIDQTRFLALSPPLADGEDAGLLNPTSPAAVTAAQPSLGLEQTAVSECIASTTASASWIPPPDRVDGPAVGRALLTLCTLPNEILLHILGFLDVSDLLSTSRVCSPAPFGSMSLVTIGGSCLGSPFSLSLSVSIPLRSLLLALFLSHMHTHTIISLGQLLCAIVVVEQTDPR
jgi:hypothetical protein